jgi:hypothetical protein
MSVQLFGSDIFAENPMRVKDYLRIANSESEFF